MLGIGEDWGLGEVGEDGRLDEDGGLMGVGVGQSTGRCWYRMTLANGG
jgi:hypothetical protein